jgi:ribulose-phosphate 3-epimerase
LKEVTTMAAVLAPSILSADFTRLGEQVALVESGGAGMIHVDVMDGHFVPNISIGPLITAAVRRVTRLPVDCHLMIERPERYVQAFVEAGADMVTVHQESQPHLDRTLNLIKEQGAKAGVALNPATPLGTLDEILELTDYVLIMSVNPGFGGQRMIPSALEKIGRLRGELSRKRPDLRIGIDGGVAEHNLDEVAATGVDVIVAGTAVYGDADPRAATERMVRRLAELAEREQAC